MSEIWAKIKKGEEFIGAAPGEIYPRTYREGDIVDGVLAKTAIELELATPGKGARPLDPEPVEAKMLKQAPENRDMGGLGERVVFLQEEVARLEKMSETHDAVLEILGVSEEMRTSIREGTFSLDDLDAFAADIKKRKGAGRQSGSDKGAGVKK